MTIVQPTRRFQFRIRTLLVLTAVCALACWAYWIGYPRFRNYLDRRQFENAACQLKAGSLFIELRAPLLDVRTVDGGVSGDAISDSAGNRWAFWRYNFATAVYFVVQYFPPPPQRDNNSTVQLSSAHVPPCVRVEVFRLPPVPAGYVPHHPKVIANLKQAGETIAEQDPSWCYEADFMFYIAGGCQDAIGVQPELIHSNPAR